MKYFKNKLNTWKEVCPANLDGLGVQGHQMEIQLILFWSYFNESTVCVKIYVGKKVKVLLTASIQIHLIHIIV